MRCALVTNAPRANVEAELAAIGLAARLTEWVLGSELERAKPDPLPYLTALERLGAEAGRSLAFEDSLSGLSAALGAGLVVVGLTTTLPADTLLAAGAIFAVADFADPRLLPLIESAHRHAGEGRMRLTQIVDDDDKRALVVTARGESRLVKGLRTTRDLALEAIAEGAPLRKIIADRGVGKPINLAAALKEKRVLIPLDHEDPAHVYVTGTGLTHLGSAEGRDEMHRTLADAFRDADRTR